MCSVKELNRLLNIAAGIETPQTEPKLRRKAQVAVEAATPLSGSLACAAGKVEVTIKPEPAATRIWKPTQVPVLEDASNIVNSPTPSVIKVNPAI